jgi:fumarate hydratase, class II
MCCTQHAFWGNACEKLRQYGIEGITLDTERISTYVNESLMLVTALSQVIGYDKASAIAHKAFDEKKTLREAALESGSIRAEEFDRIVVPAMMVGNPHKDLGLA